MAQVSVGVCTEHHSRGHQYSDKRDRRNTDARLIIVKAIRRGVPFPEVIPCTFPHTEIDPYDWINHRTIKLTAVAIFHGLLRWVNGMYLRPGVLVSRDTLIGTLSALAYAHAPDQITDAVQRITR